MGEGSWDLQVRELYEGPLAQFVARRTALVRQVRASGERDEAQAILALRKPTTAADAINRVMHAGHPAVQELVHVGTRLRQAQSALDATELTALRAPRDAVVDGWLRATQEVGGPHTPGVHAEIRDTIIAALADADAQEVVCSGALTRALGYSGFGEVDISDAVARTSTGVLLTRLEGGAGSAKTSAAVAEPAAGAEPAVGAEPDQQAETAQQAGAEPDPPPEPALDAVPDPVVRQAELAAARAEVTGAERERARVREEVAQAGRLLAHARRRADAAQTAYEVALARWDELSAEVSSPSD